MSLNRRWGGGGGGESLSAYLYIRMSVYVSAVSCLSMGMSVLECQRKKNSRRRSVEIPNIITFEVLRTLRTPIKV